MRIVRKNSEVENFSGTQLDITGQADHCPFSGNCRLTYQSGGVYVKNTKRKSLLSSLALGCLRRVNLPVVWLKTNPWGTTEWMPPWAKMWQCCASKSAIFGRWHTQTLRCRERQLNFIGSDTTDDEGTATIAQDIDSVDCCLDCSGEATFWPFSWRRFTMPQSPPFVGQTNSHEDAPVTIKTVFRFWAIKGTKGRVSFSVNFCCVYILNKKAALGTAKSRKKSSFMFMWIRRHPTDICEEGWQ